MIKQNYRLVIRNYGFKFYNYKDKIHRLGDPACIWPDDEQHYYVNGAPHRLGGPAIIYKDRYSAYFVDGERHRLDGPAEIWQKGDGWGEHYYVNGKLVSEADFYEKYYQKKND